MSARPKLLTTKTRRWLIEEMKNTTAWKDQQAADMAKVQSAVNLSKWEQETELLERFPIRSEWFDAS